MSKYSCKAEVVQVFFTVHTEVRIESCSSPQGQHPLHQDLFAASGGRSMHSEGMVLCEHNQSLVSPSKYWLSGLCVAGQ